MTTTYAKHMRRMIPISALLLSLSIHAQPEEKQLGNWVTGEKGAGIYNKMRITPDTISIAPGNRSDYFYFAPEENPIWCKTNYKVISRSHGDSYPDQDSGSRAIARKVGRKYEIVLLELEHGECVGFLLQMAFPSDIDNAADVTTYDEKHRGRSWLFYHRVVQGVK